MASGLNNFIKQNTAGIGGASNLLLVPQLVSAQNKGRELIKVMADMVLWANKFTRAWMLAPALLALWGTFGKTVREMVRDTGSLDVALRRIASMQTLGRQLAPFVGGLQAAREKVSQILTLSQRGPFSFEELGGASRSLATFTRGTYSSSEALQTVGSVAIATGNRVGDIAESVGQFYAALRGGEPVSAASEQLRQLGVITQQDADLLDQMQQSGASNGQVFAQLTSILDSTRGRLGGVNAELATVNAEFGKAQEELAQKFGSPFTQDEVTNTRNYTKALQDVGPAAGRVAAFYAAFANGLSTVKSSVAGAVAGNSALRGTFELLAKSLPVVIAALTLFGITLIPRMIVSIVGLAGALGAAVPAISGFATALGLLASATVIGAVIIVLAAAVGTFINFQRQAEETRRRVVDLTKAHREVQAAIDAQTAAVETLTDRHEALAKAVGNVIDLQAKLNKQNAEGAPEAEVDETKRARDEALAKLKDAAKTPITGLASPQLETALEFGAERRQRAQDRAAENFGGREQLLRGRAQRGRAGIEASVAVAGVRGQFEGPRAVVQAELGQFKQSLADLEARNDIPNKDEFRKNFETQIATRQKRLNEIDARSLRVGLRAPSGSSVNLLTQAEQLQHSVNAQRLATEGMGTEAQREFALAGGAKAGPDAGRRILDLRVQAREAARIEAETAQNEDAARRLRAEAATTRTGQDLELRQHAAQRRGDFRTAVSLGDEATFAQHFEQNRGLFSPEEARKRSLEQSKDDILESIRNRPTVVDSLQALGLGGNAGARDPMLEAARRQEDLLRTSTEYLRTIADQIGREDARPVAIYGD